MFSEAKDAGSGGDSWSYTSCKAPVKSSPPTNQHQVSITVFCPNALMVDRFPTHPSRLGQNTIARCQKGHHPVKRNGMEQNLSGAMLALFHFTAAFAVNGVIASFMFLYRHLIPLQSLLHRFPESTTPRSIILFKP